MSRKRRRFLKIRVRLGMIINIYDKRILGAELSDFRLVRQSTMFPACPEAFILKGSLRNVTYAEYLNDNDTMRTLKLSQSQLSNLESEGEHNIMCTFLCLHLNVIASRQSNLCHDLKNSTDLTTTLMINAIALPR